MLGTSIWGIGPDKLWHGTLDPPYEIAADAINGNTLLAIPVGHVLDMLTYALGEFRSVSSVLAVGRTEAVRTRDGAKVPVTAHDQVAIAGVLESGALASLHYHGGEAHGPTFEWQINGSIADLRILASQGYGNISVLHVEEGRSGCPWKTIDLPPSYCAAPVSIPETASNIHAVYAQFATDLRTGSRLAPDFGDAKRRHALLDAIETANRTGQRQTFN